MDAFYVSVEMRTRPDLRGLPVVVGGNGRRGVVAAASYEARRYGVHSALPSSVARRRCPHAVFLPGNHRLYEEVSASVHEVFQRYTPLIEPLALDEAFLDVSGATRLFGDGIAIAQRIRDDILQELELGCSVGVAPNKFLAKMASVQAKPRATPEAVLPGRGVVEVRPGGELDFLRPLDVGRLWGVGPKMLERLQRLGVHRVGDIAALGERTMITSLGPSSGSHLWALSQGLDERPVESHRDPKSIGHEETYEVNKHTTEELDRELVRLADAVGQRLRRASVGARTLTLKLRFDDGFRTISRSTTLAHPTDLAPDIVAALRPSLVEIDPSSGVRLLGVSGSKLGPLSRQLSLDDLMAAPGPDWTATTEALDGIRQRFGDGSIGPASSLGSRPLSHREDRGRPTNGVSGSS